MEKLQLHCVQGKRFIRSSTNWSAQTYAFNTCSSSTQTRPGNNKLFPCTNLTQRFLQLLVWHRILTFHSRKCSICWSVLNTMYNIQIHGIISALSFNAVFKTELINRRKTILLHKFYIKLIDYSSSIKQKWKFILMTSPVCASWIKSLLWSDQEGDEIILWSYDCMVLPRKKMQRKQTADPLTLQFLFDAFTSSLKHFIIICL